jgi:hypothetical protein
VGPRRVLDTKTYWLTDCQSQCDFDFDFDSETVTMQQQPSAVSQWIVSMWLVATSADREITESSEVQQLRVELYRVNCDTVDGSNCKIVNGVSVRL